MYAVELQNFLNIDIQTSRKGWSKKVLCPYCKGGKSKERSFTYNVENGGWKCHKVNNCGKSGSVARMKNFKPVSKKYQESVYNKKLDSFFKSRAINPKVAKELGIGMSPQYNPVFRYIRNGSVINAKERIEKDGKKTFLQSAGTEHILYNLDSLEGKEEAIFVEGEMDVAAIETMFATKGFTKLKEKYGVVSFDQGAGEWGSDLKGKLECLENCYPELKKIKVFHLFTDNDKPGLWLQKEMIRRYGAMRCNTIDSLSYKDANEVLMDKNYDFEMRCQTLKGFIENSRPAPKENVLNVKSVADSMFNFYDNGFPKGKTTHFKCLDPYFTMLPGEVTVWTGIPGDGKSQFLRQMMLHTAKHNGDKWACYVPENYPFESFLNQLAFTYLGKSLRAGVDNRATKAELREALDFLDKHFYYIDYPHEKNAEGKFTPPTLEWINERLIYLRERYGVNSVTLDPYNKIGSTQQSFQREDQYLGEWFSEAKGIAKDYKSFNLIAHPTKLQKVKIEGGGTGYPNPGPYNISGGAQWNNAPDNVLSIYRHGRHSGFPEDTGVTIKSWKIRYQDAVGVEGKVKISFNRLTNRYEEKIDGNWIDPMSLEVVETPNNFIVDDVADVGDGTVYSTKTPKTLEEKQAAAAAKAYDDARDLEGAQPNFDSNNDDLPF